ncbi:MAG: hypothetical protein FD170_1211 [Bacteroidetes bacterium]|nr:MAG: hypothetical protein FD170_1211 [Bacteroidota bacterium]
MTDMTRFHNAFKKIFELLYHIKRLSVSREYFLPSGISLKENRKLLNTCTLKHI